MAQRRLTGLGSSSCQPTDPGFRAGWSHETDLREWVRGDGARCYDFTISNVGLVETQGAGSQDPDSQAGSSQQGIQHVFVYFAEAPLTDAYTDFGVWRAACVRAQWVPPSVRFPADPEVILRDEDFFPAEQMARNPLDLPCAGLLPPGAAATASPP